MNPYDIIPDRDPSVPEGAHATIHEHRDVHVHQRAPGFHSDGWTLDEFVEFLRHESMFVGTFHDTTSYHHATGGARARHHYTAKRIATGYGGRIVQTQTIAYFHGTESYSLLTTEVQSEEEGRQP